MGRAHLGNSTATHVNSGTKEFHVCRISTVYKVHWEAGVYKCRDRTQSKVH